MVIFVFYILFVTLSDLDVLYSPLKRQTIIAAADILIFYFYLSKKTRTEFTCESSLEKSSLIFSEKNEKIFMNVVCCSRDWRFKG